MDLFGIVGNDVRVRILRMLAEKNSCTFTELNDVCGVSSGTLAYHLAIMNELISKTGDDYCLTTIGRFAYELVKQVKTFYKEDMKIITSEQHRDPSVHDQDLF